MNKGIQSSLEMLRQIMNLSGYKIKKIEAVMDWYHVEPDGREYCKEVAEITYENGYVLYADIGCDSNPAAVYDTLGVIIREKKSSAKIERIVRCIADDGGMK